jgi:hypothetical protein
MAKRAFILWTGVSIATGIAPATSPGQLADPLGIPKIQFATNVIDFGKAGVGEVVKATFYFTNVGTAPLELTDVRPGCGCTAAGAWDRRVEPGKIGSIPLQLNTTGFGGTITKTATITCNDPAAATHILQIRGEVWKPIDVAPSFVVFNIFGMPASNEVRVVKIKNNTPQPLSVTDAQSGNPAFKATIREVEPNKEYDLEVELVSPPGSGTVQGVITAKTTSTSLPVVSVTAMAMVQAPITVAPTQIALPAGSLATARPVTVSLYSRHATGITLSNPKVSFTNVSVGLREIQAGRVYNLTLTFPAGFELDAGQRGELTVQTTHPQMPEVKVPIFQMPQPTPMTQIPARPSTLVQPSKPITPRVVSPAIRAQPKPVVPPPAPPPPPPAPRQSGS